MSFFPFTFEIISSFKKEGATAPRCPLKFPQPEAEATVVKFKVNIKFKNIISTLLHCLRLWQEASPGAQNGSDLPRRAVIHGDSSRKTNPVTLSAGLQQLQKDTVAAAR